MLTPPIAHVFFSCRHLSTKNQACQTLNWARVPALWYTDFFGARQNANWLVVFLPSWNILSYLWEGWHPIYEMENRKCFETTNQVENMSDGRWWKSECMSEYMSDRMIECQIAWYMPRWWSHEIQKESDSCWLCLCNIWELELDKCRTGVHHVLLMERVVFAVFGSGMSVEFCMVFAALRG